MKAVKLNIHRVIAFLSLFLLIISCDSKEKEEFKEVNYSHFTKATFVGSESCKDCHEEAYTNWENSHHDQAMKIADSTSILADFNNTIFVHNKIKNTFFKKDGDFYVNTANEKGIYQDYKIVYTFGFTPLQQYLVKFPDGKYQCLLTAWDSVENKWFHLQPDLDIEHGEWINWSGGSQTWNNMCADCHSTNLHKNYTSETQTYNTTFDEINVGCEACHGPASEHNRYFEENPEGQNPPEMYVGNLLPGSEVVDKCARCHARRSQLTKYFDYSGEFWDHYSPRVLVDPLYELDGQIRDEVYVYGSFKQSKMYSKGISCRDCHDVHSMKLKKSDNEMCMTCHTPNYNTKEHHYHEMNTEAALCVNCHMTGKIYMGNDFRRDHSFRIPRPDQSLKYGTPNACTACHDDKNDQWASDFIIEKYGLERADHFSDHLLKGYFEDYHAFETVFSDKKYPEIARATALNRYASQPLSLNEMESLKVYLKDSSVWMRTETIQAFELFANNQFSEYIKPLLKDSIRIARISAARYLHNMGENLMDDINFKKAKKEYFTQLDISSDFPSGRHQKALYYQVSGNNEMAIENYLDAIEIDNLYNRSRMNLALIYYEQGRIEECEKLYLKVIEQEPEFSYSYYMLGLLYNESGNIGKALDYLKLATERVPQNMNAYYNYGLLLQKNDKNKESIQLIVKALKSFPENERLLYVKLLGELNINSLENARKSCMRLLRIAPNNSNYQQIMMKLNQN